MWEYKNLAEVIKGHTVNGNWQSHCYWFLLSVLAEVRGIIVFRACFDCLSLTAMNLNAVAVLEVSYGTWWREWLWSVWKCCVFFVFFNSQDGLADKLDAILNLVCLRKYCFYVAFVVELVCNKNNGLNLLWILSPWSQQNYIKGKCRTVIVGNL